jgi:hypothetical protein
MKFFRNRGYNFRFLWKTETFDIFFTGDLINLGIFSREVSHFFGGYFFFHLVYIFLYF